MHREHETIKCGRVAGLGGFAAAAAAFLPGAFLAIAWPEVQTVNPKITKHKPQLPRNEYALAPVTDSCLKRRIQDACMVVLCVALHYFDTVSRGLDRVWTRFGQ